MSRGQGQQLGAILNRALRDLGVAGRMEEEKVRQKWSSCAGDAAAAHTEPRSLRRGRLHVTVDSSSWAHRLAAGESLAIRDRVNGVLGYEAVREVFFRVGTLKRGRG